MTSDTYVPRPNPTSASHKAIAERECDSMTGVPRLKQDTADVSTGHKRHVIRSQKSVAKERRHKENNVGQNSHCPA